MEIMTSLTSEFFREYKLHSNFNSIHRQTTSSRSTYTIFEITLDDVRAEISLISLIIHYWLAFIIIGFASTTSKSVSVSWLNKSERTRASEGNVTRKNQKIRREEFTLLMRYRRWLQQREKESKYKNTLCGYVSKGKKRRKRTQTLMTHESEFF